MKGTKLLFLCATSGGQTDWPAGFPFKCLYFSRGTGWLHCIRPPSRWPHTQGCPCHQTRLPSHFITEERLFPSAPCSHTRHFPPSHFFLHMIAAIPNPCCLSTSTHLTTGETFWSALNTQWLLILVLYDHTFPAPPHCFAVLGTGRTASPWGQEYSQCLVICTREIGGITY